MRIAVGSDHAAFELKEAIEAHLKDQGHEVVDVGTHSLESTDYPSYGEAVGKLVASGQVERGIVCCGTGVGISIAANKVPGVRAAVCWNTEVARLTRLHNDANVLALAGRFIAVPHALMIVDAWLQTEFEGGRHARRVSLIAEIEARHQPKADG
ncbi:MAG: ribose 5-phosphate isomerase B [Candidatus Poribacteria bacterium]|nr:MAG: ribose 5-phosphate isomerase B [Candidatus Poribacteria bacterium]